LDEPLIDRIYECAFVPEFWPALLDDLAQIAEARGGCLLTANTAVLNWTASASLNEVWDTLIAKNLMACGERFRRLVALEHAGFLTDLDGYVGEAEMADDPLYRDVLWPIGLGWATATAMPLPTGDTMVLTLERERARGPVEPEIVRQLDGLRPHLARSALLSARLELQRARQISQTLDLLGLPALVFDADGRVLAANPSIEDLKSTVRWRAQDRISLRDVSADALLQQAVAGLSQTVAAAGPPDVRSFAVRGDLVEPSTVAHVIPIRGAARDVFVRCAGVLVLTPVTRPQALPVELVQSLFDLTPAEARVARGLSAGDTVEDIAAKSGLSPTTIRNQVRGVLLKTGSRRQADLVALLGNIGKAR
jgi:DNA-binding CsgD family transcriptional regulator